MFMRALRFVAVGVCLPLMLGLFVGLTQGTPQIMNASDVAASIGGYDGCPCLGHTIALCTSIPGFTCTEYYKKCNLKSGELNTCKRAIGPRLFCTTTGTCNPTFEDVCSYP